MPDIVTHATFAKDVVERIENQTIKHMLNKNQPLYYLGSQGPDVFFFNSKTKGYTRFGSFMHNNHVDDFLYESIIYLKEHYDDQLYSYLIGFLCHQALDSKAHPYVYHVTGLYQAADQDTHHFRGNHMRLERAIDSIFIQKYWNEQDPHCFRIDQKILNYKIDKDIFGPYYQYVFKKVFNRENGDQVFFSSAKNFKRYSKFLCDPKGRKKKLAKRLDQAFNRKSKLVIETLFHHQNVNESMDYLNTNNKEWRHPVNQVVSNKSFMELYNDGIIEVISIIKKVNQYLNNQIAKEELRLNIPKDSYSTGLDWRTSNSMTHFGSIF